MSTEHELSRLFEAERGEAEGAGDRTRGWERLEGALAAGTPPMAVSLAPLKLGISTLVYFGSGVGAVALVVGATVLTREPHEPPRPMPPPTVEGRPIAAEPPAAEPTTSPADRTPPLERPAPSGSVERDARFAEELRLIKLAKREIDGGRAHLAEVWLDEHGRRFPSGVFRTERDALRILVACAAEPARGERRARDFVRVNPRSPLVDRISRACGLGDAAAGDPKIEK